MGGRLICLGDSNTEGIYDSQNRGWPGRLATHLAATQPNVWNVMNLGVAGDTSIDIRHRLLTEVLYREPERLIIAAGVNDTAQRLWPHPTGCRVDITAAKTIWLGILTKLKKSGIRTFFISPLPVDEARMPLVYMPYDDQDKGHLLDNEKIHGYTQMLGSIVRDAGYGWLDVYSLWKDRDYAGLLHDGLHPNDAGYDLLAKDIGTALEADKFI